MVKGADPMFNEDFLRMLELSQQGFYCSQILLTLGLENQGKENPDLIRAMNGLIGGLCFAGKLCGALSGGACLLALYAGKGTAGEQGDPKLELMIHRLVEWFEEQYGERYGGIDCDDILENNPQNRPQRCPQIVRETYAKVQELLLENGFQLEG
jgi:C_GCAxxG_C_C family probable redox protein